MYEWNETTQSSILGTIDGQLFNLSDIVAVTRYYPDTELPSTLREKDIFRDCKSAIYLRTIEGSFPGPSTVEEVLERINEMLRNAYDEARRKK